MLIKESAKLKLGIKSSSIKSVTLPPLFVKRFQPLSDRFPSAPPRIKVKE
jgi:hypothetical protein